MQALLDDNVDTATDTYGDLVKRGQSLVGRIRRQQSTKATVTSAQKTAANAVQAVVDAAEKVGD